MHMILMSVSRDEHDLASRFEDVSVGYRSGAAENTGATKTPLYLWALNVETSIQNHTGGGNKRDNKKKWDTKSLITWKNLPQIERVNNHGHEPENNPL